MCVKDSIQGTGMCPCDYNCSSSAFVCVCELTDLPHSNDSICNEDEEDDEGFHEGSDCLLTFLKPSQHLRQTDIIMSLLVHSLAIPKLYLLTFRKLFSLLKNKEIDLYTAVDNIRLRICICAVGHSNSNTYVRRREKSSKKFGKKC